MNQIRKTNAYPVLKVVRRRHALGPCPVNSALPESSQPHVARNWSYSISRLAPACLNRIGRVIQWTLLFALCALFGVAWSANCHIATVPASVSVAAQYDSFGEHAPEDNETDSMLQYALLSAGTLPVNARKGSRRKSEIERDRKLNWVRINHEIDELVAEAHRKLPRSQAKEIGAIYARYSTRHQDSVGDQVRTILEAAIRLEIFVPREMVFFDLAVRGFKKNRGGLGALEAALLKKTVNTVLFFSTSRLFRKTYRTLEFVDKLHKSLQLRCIFVKSGVDTNDSGRWEALLYMQSMFDQFVVTMYIANIHAAQEGLLEKRMVFGTISYGYVGEPIPAVFTHRGKQRCRIQIDPETAAIVVEIFTWYAKEHVSLDEIIRRLNERNCPLPPRSTTGMWSRDAVTGVLKNTRYRALWKYGVKEAVYLPDKDYTRQRMRAEPLKEVMIEELRIVPDDLWFAAQERLADERKKRGRKPKDGDYQSRPRILNELLICPEHNQVLYVGGPFGRGMFCPICRRLRGPQRPLFTILIRHLALRLICEQLANLIRQDEELVGNVITACQQYAQTLQRPAPRELADLKAQHEQLTRTIAFAQRNVGETAEDQEETSRNIQRFRSERSEISQKIIRLESAQRRAISIPTEEQIRADVDHLHEILTNAIAGQAEDVEHVREIIKLLTGGRIELYQQGERQPHRGWLQARFKLRLLNVFAERAAGVPIEANPGIEVAIDLKHPRPLEFEMEADRAWELDQQDILRIDIAKQLGCGKSKITKLLKHAAQKHGVEFVDGRGRRSELQRKSRKPPKRLPKNRK